MDCSLPGSSVHGIFQARVLEWDAFSSPGNLPIQGLNPGLLHCRRTLYPLSHKGNPNVILNVDYFHLFVVVQSLNSDCLRPHELQQHQAYLSITISQSLLKFMSFESVMPSNHLILCRCVIANPDIIFLEYSLLS